MNCKHCGKPVVLMPSARERAEKYGGKPSDYTRLFDAHSDCILEERKKGVERLMKSPGYRANSPSTL